MKSNIINEMNRTQTRDERFDSYLKDLVDSFYTFISSVPFPHKWLENAINEFQLKNIEDFGSTSWGASILKYAKDVIDAEII